MHSSLGPSRKTDTDLSRYEILELHFDLFSRFLPFKREGAGGQGYQHEMTERVGLLGPVIPVSLAVGAGVWSQEVGFLALSETGVIGHCQLRRLICIEMGISWIFHFSVMDSCCGHEVPQQPGHLIKPILSVIVN